MEAPLPWRLTRLTVEGVAQAVAALTPSRDDALGGLDVVVGGAARVADAVDRVAAPVGRAVAGWPLFDGLAERGRRERAAAASDLERLVTVVVTAVLDRIDLTALVRDRVDLDALVAEVDVDAVAARVDVDAIAARVDVAAIADRLDLVGLANQTVDGMDLAELIRNSTGSVTDDMVRGVRMQGVQADQAVAGFVARVLRRRSGPVAT